MSTIIQQMTNDRINAAGKHPDFRPGDTVVASLKIVEGEKSRVQPFEGIVVAIRNRGLGSSVTVRKMSHGIGVEKVIPLYAPTLEKLEIKRRGKVRRAKLYYLRDLSGKSARIKEKLGKRITEKK